MISRDLIYNNKTLTSIKQSLCSLRRNKLIKKATPYELLFKEKLDAAGIKYIFQKGFIIGNNFCIADFYLPNPYRLVIEIDGEYHNENNQKKRDLNKNKYYRDRGLRIKRIKNEDVLNFNVKFLIKECDAKYKPYKQISKKITLIRLNV